jgi:hypothetical protein
MSLAGKHTDRPVIGLTHAQAGLALKALSDAENHRRLRADQRCTDCETAPQGACDDHLDDLDLADEFRRLAGELTDVLSDRTLGK